MRRAVLSLLFLSSLQYHSPCVRGFLPVSIRSPKTSVATRTVRQSPTTLLYGTNRNQQQQQKQRQQQTEETEEDWGNHWIRPSAAATDDDVLDLLLEPNVNNDENDTLAMDVSVDGTLLRTGPLSQQIDAALQQRLPDPVSRRALVAQMTALQVLQVVVQHSGLELTTTERIEGTVEALHVPEQNATFDSWEALAEHWQPGQTLSFRLRQVPTRRRAVSWETMRSSLTPPEGLDPDMDDMDDDDEDPPITTLAELRADHTRRVARAPRPVQTDSPYTGTETRGYRVLSAHEIRAAQARQAAGATDPDALISAVTRHVMHALVAHGCLLVEWTDAAEVATMARMWEEVATLLDPAHISQLPPLQKVDNHDVHSQHIKVGFASYQDGHMQFLERRRRSNGTWCPESPGTTALAATFDLQAALGRALVQLVVAASSEEVGGAVDGAVRLARDWVDDGTAWSPENDDDDSNITTTPTTTTRISMSPQRLCRYQEGSETDTELFGAHTDSSFLTVVPVAAVAGLEVYDEAAAQWYRPEAAAWQHYSRQSEPAVAASPWYARYAVFMAGEWLQLASGNQVAAVVHRVIASNRTSAPVLLRARPEVRWDTRKYLGVEDPSHPAVWPVWKECQGKRLSEIHAALQ